MDGDGKLAPLIRGEAGPRKAHRPELDGLRAVAIGLVALFHAYPKQFHGGWIGVDIFFVLSGFLITGILTSELDRTATIALPRFYLRRFLRLAPALAVLLIVIAIIEFVILGHWRLGVAFPIVMAGTYLMNWNRAFHWGETGFLGHTWSLAIEEQFYFLWPLVLLWIPRRLRLSATLWLLLAAIGWRAFLWAMGADAARLYNGFDTHADSLLVGCALAQIAVGDRLANLLARLWYVPVALIAALTALLRYDSVAAILWGFPAVSLLAAWLIVASGRPGPLQRGLSLAVPVYLGQISYGIYLWHDPMLIYLRGFLPYWAAIVPVLVAVGIAAASWRWIEAPVNRLKDRWAR